MGKIRSILIIALLTGAKGVMLGQTPPSALSPNYQMVPTTTWALQNQGGGTYVVQGTDTKTITFTINPGNQQNLKYRWNVNEDTTRWNIRLLEGGPNGTPRPQNRNGPMWVSSYPITQRITLVISAQSTRESGAFPNRYDGSIELLSGSNNLVATARFDGRSERSTASQQQQQAQPQQQQQQVQPQQQTRPPNRKQQQWQQMQQLGNRVQWQGAPTTTLKARFNPKTGKMELIQNGVITRKGYLNLVGGSLNRRQTLRNYRYR